MKIPNDIASEEELGRSVFSKRHVQLVERVTRVRYRAFLCPPGVVEISVNRLGFASVDEMARISARGEAKRPGPFLGWAVITAGQVLEDERQVQAKMEDGNPYHANILLPEITAKNRDEQRSHAQKLADASSWCASPLFDST